MREHWASPVGGCAPSKSDGLPVASWRSEVERWLGGGHPVYLVLDAPLVTPEVWLTLGPSTTDENIAPGVFWHCNGETRVGLGSYFEATCAWGDSPSLKETVSSALGRMKVVGPGGARCSPWAFSAIGFAPSQRRGATAIWIDFQTGWASIPRLTYVRSSTSRPASKVTGASAADGATAWLCLALSPDDLERLDALLHQVATLLRRVRAATIHPGAIASTPSRTGGTAEGSWNAAVTDAIAEIATERIEKVVAARFAQYTYSKPPSPAHTLLSLGQRHADSTRFAFFRGRSVFMGASPERLVAKSGLHIATEALAGTVQRRQQQTSPASDFGPKEHKEHTPVLDQILTTLVRFCASVSHDPTPQVRSQQDVVHLRTPIRGELRSPYHVLDLVGALHPTPAVGGRPAIEALRWIEQHEDFERGLYAGPVGWFDASGDGQFDVALRSGVLVDNQLTVFAGAGIVTGSEPSREFEETALKMHVLLDAVCNGIAACPVDTACHAPEPTASS